MIRAINELPSQSSCLVDLLTVPEECVSDLASKIKECAARGMCSCVCMWTLNSASYFVCR